MGLSQAFLSQRLFDAPSPGTPPFGASETARKQLPARHSAAPAKIQPNPRRRRFSWRLRRRVLRLIVAASVIVVLAYTLPLLRLVAWPILPPLQPALINLSGWLGGRIDNVVVEGRLRTAPETILAALGANNGDPILGFDAEAARERLIALPWIADATVERALPSSLKITLTERSPFALWQQNGTVQLIDQRGTVIVGEEAEKYPDLPLLVGVGAATHAESLVQLINSQPDLAKRVSAAIRVGDRRWDLILDNHLRVRLGESEVALALARLAELAATQKLLERDLVTIDLRLPDRVVLQLAPATAARLEAENTPKKPAFAKPPAGKPPSPPTSPSMEEAPQ